MAKVYRSPAGPWRPARPGFPLGNHGAYVASGGGVGIVIDLSPVVASITGTLNGFSNATRNWALSRALNKVGAPLVTAVRRDVAKETSIKYGDLKDKIVGIPSTAGNLYYKIKATSTALPLINFVTSSRALGTRGVTVKAWGKQKTYKKAFIAPYRNFGAQVAIHTMHGPGSRKRVAGHGDLKVLWGPISAKEMIRPGNPSTERIARAMPDKIIPEIIRQLGLAEQQGRK